MKVELTGYTKYFDVEDDNGDEYTVCQTYDESSQNCSWEVFPFSDILDTKNKVSKKLEKKIIKAVIKFEEGKK